MKLVFATQNQNKVREIQSQLKEGHHLINLKDLEYFEELEESQDNLEGNAFQKADFVFEKFNLSCFADDTGLEIDALNGRPGVYSARYAGEDKSFDDNMNKVLEELKGETNRKARFKTVIALILEGKKFKFEGICEGEILKEKRGGEGFGYDPIFQPEGFDLSFAEMTLEDKSKISHRGIAVKALINFLNAQSNT